MNVQNKERKQKPLITTLKRNNRFLLYNMIVQSSKKFILKLKSVFFYTSFIIGSATSPSHDDHDTEVFEQVKEIENRFGKIVVHFGVWCNVRHTFLKSFLHVQVEVMIRNILATVVPSIYLLT